MIKLVAIDIDGTLVNEQKILTKKVRDAIRQAMAKGVKIVLSTGRPIEGIKPYLKELGFSEEEDYVISQNGAAITRTDTMEIIAQETHPFSDLKDLYQLGKAFPTDTLMLNETHFYMVLPHGVEPSVDPDVLDEGETLNMDVEVIHIDHLNEESDILKVTYFGEVGEVDEVMAVIPDEFYERFYIVRNEPYLIDVMVKGVNKGMALRKLAKHLDLALEEVMAIGDGENDYEMLEAAGLGIAMANGTDRLKSIASDITLSNEEDGVAYAFEKWVL